MKDFPLFTTENGAASLVLKEIPYRKTAYIRIQDSVSPDQLLEECISFCRVCGAEKIFAAGSDILENYPFHTAIYEMRGVLSIQEDEIPNLFPVTEQTVGKWREIYNDKMKLIDNASTMEQKDESRILTSGGAYFVHNHGSLLGIGWLEETRISAIASLSPGAGTLICKAMQSLVPQQQMILEVASSNTKALRLYEHLGFLKTAELSRWYQVL